MCTQKKVYVVVCLCVCHKIYKCQVIMIKLQEKMKHRKTNNGNKQIQ
jgi:hypothetical protein